MHVDEAFGKGTSGRSVDAAEVEKFERMAAEWWDPQGKFKPLHMLNPVRLDYIVTRRSRPKCPARRVTM